MTKDKTVRWVVLETYPYRDDLIGHSTLISVHKNIKDAGKAVLKYTNKNGKNVEVCAYEIHLTWSPLGEMLGKDPDNKVFAKR